MRPGSTAQRIKVEEAHKQPGVFTGNVELAFHRAQFHPAYLAVVTFKLGINIWGVTGMGIVINILPHIYWRALHTVFPLAVRAFAQPAVG